MRKYILCMLLLLLTACQSTARQAESPTPVPTPTPMATVTPMPEPTPSPTPEPTAVGVEVDIGDGEHKFWVEAIDTGKPSYDGTVALIRIYRDREDVEPFQTFEETLYRGPLEVAPVDVDFDGDMDFFVRLHPYFPRSQAYYIWDAAEEKFISDPYGLKDLSDAEFDPEKKIVKKTLGGGDIGGTQICYYRYEKDSLLCVRVLEWGFSLTTKKVDLLIKDGWDGELETVYECAVSVDDWSNGTGSVEEFKRWYDLDYHGE